MTLRVRDLGVAILASGLSLAGASAVAQTANLPDAQIEANVLRALAGASDLSTQNIQTSTVYGTVTLTGNVHDETLRGKAENLVARAVGVKKVVDELSLGDTPAAAANTEQPQPDPNAGNQPMDNSQGQTSGQVLMSDGTYAPAPQSPDQGGPNQPMQTQNQAPPPPQAGYPQGNYPQQQGGYPQGNDPQAQGGYPQGNYPPQGPPTDRRPMYQNYGPQGQPGPQGGQQAGLAVTVPAGAILRIRINRGLDSNHIQPGTPFDGTVLSDVIAGGAVAIPRGALVQGSVLDAKKAGVFKGRGELALQINSISLGGATYPISTQVWQREGRDKTVGTVNSALGLGALGAVLGGVAGGGAGAAIGAGVGAGVGVAGSAASPRGQIIVPPESVLTFSLAQPAALKTVSEQEMARLSYAAGPGQPGPRPVVRRRYYSPYYGSYYGPAY